MSGTDGILLVLLGAGALVEAASHPVTRLLRCLLILRRAGLAGDLLTDPKAAEANACAIARHREIATQARALLDAHPPAPMPRRFFSDFG